MRDLNIWDSDPAIIIAHIYMKKISCISRKLSLIELENRFLYKYAVCDKIESICFYIERICGV